MIASARPGRRTLAEQTRRLEATLREDAGSCERYSASAFIGCSTPYHGVHSTHRSANHVHEQNYLASIPMPFLYQYTNTSRESIVSAFAIVGAHAQPPSTQEDHYNDNHMFERDIYASFGVFFDLFMDADIDSLASRTAAITPAHLPALQTRVNELHSQIMAHHAKKQTTFPFPGGHLPVGPSKAVFTAKNFEDCTRAYFMMFHPQHPFIHRPSFDLNKVCLPLLLAVAFAGSVHCTPRDAALSTRLFFDLGEDMIFEQLREVVANTSRRDECALETVQAALLILALQISFNDEVIRRRIRISRHPELVASMRSLGLTEPTSTRDSRNSDWNSFIAEETRVRYFQW